MKIIEHLMSPRQLTVARLLMKGRNNREMSEELGISEESIKKVMLALFYKFRIDEDGVRRVKLAVKLFELGMD